MEGGVQDMICIGIDPSLTGTGLIILENEKIVNQVLIATNSKQPMEERLISIGEQIEYRCVEYTNSKIFIEGIAFAKKSTYAHQLGALHYYIRIRLYPDHNVTVVPPTELKKFVTGKGNCKKDLMLMKTYKRWGIEFDDDNLCDAYCLARYAASKSTKPLRKRR
jgi:crossover junction endodeoxyribonuclease RuvC